MQLPIGTITFLFSDIEGSTRLWESNPEEMRAAVARHDALLRDAIGAENGYVVKSTGDGIMAAFHTATDALAAALAAQKGLQSEEWPEPIKIAARMGLHTGAAELRDGDYFGPALNRAARLMAAGHGGQVLLSDATQELCRDSLLPSVSLLNLGEHRLKDLARSETIYQAQHSDFLSTFPPLKTLDNPDLPNNLPQQVTSFIGREKETGEVRALLGKTRLLTLTGTGGSGKTRLSLQVAADVLEQYPDGVWLVELASLSDPALVPQSVASALGFQEQAGRTIEQVLTENLKTRRLLLLMDNAEHVVSASAALVSALLRSCPQVDVIVTSREPLGISGETTYRVPSLSLPSAKQAATATAEYLNQFEAVRLFIERAQSVKPDFTVTNQTAPALAQLCDRLDGIPLALELAAARVRSLSVEDINNRLDNRFRLLTGGDRAALPRQQTLRALVDWSYDLLNDSEKTLLARLSVFAGGWTLAAAETVCAGEPASPGFDPIEDWEVLDFLTSLTDKSLTHADGSEQSTRYRMLETVRQYAVEKLADSGEAVTVRDRHRDWCVTLAEEAEPRLDGPEQVPWLNRLETEHDNFRAALDWCAMTAGDDSDADTAGLRLAGALSEFWLVRGFLNEGRKQLELSIQRARDRPESSEVLTAWKPASRALRACGKLAFSQGDRRAARALLEEAVSLLRILDDERALAAR